MRDRARVDARHLQQVLKKTGEPIDFGDDQLALFAALLLIRPRRSQVVGGDTNGRERRPQVVSERRQERRLQLFALARQLGSLPFLEELHALDGNRRETGDRVERAGVDGPARGGEKTDPPCPEAKRHDPDFVPGLGDDGVPSPDGVVESTRRQRPQR